MKTNNAENFRKPVKIFARVAKFRRGCEIFASTSEIETKLQSVITFSSELRFTRSWTLRKDI